MKLMLDTGVSGSAARHVRTAGHDVTWTAEWDRDPGDQQILMTALKENRVVITLDKDFGELAIVYRIPHYGIIRLAGISAIEQGATIDDVLKRYGPELLGGAIVTVEPGRVRVRPASE